MRKEARVELQVKQARIQNYHEGGSRANREQYAREGFEKNFFWASDRPIPIDSEFKMADGSAISGFAFEIETETWGLKSTEIVANTLEKVIFPIFPKCLFKMQHDGSLGTSRRIKLYNGIDGSWDETWEEEAIGVECITQVMTKAFIRNHYRQFKAMYNEYFPMFGFSCVKSGQCGMHVNISLPQFGKTKAARDEAIRKLFYIVNRHYDFCCHLFNRDPNKTDYCNRQDYTIARTMDLASFYSDHHAAVNFGHYQNGEPGGRIELRIVSGQSSFACFRNSVEAVFHIMEAVKRLSWKQLDSLEAIFSGCNQYVFDRIKTKCFRANTISAEAVEKIRATVKQEILL